ncbi:MAG: aldo/keto reductase [Frankiales bacterium]|nr:aldo/keto reductase [Frankiales bacterium]
MPLLGFGTWQLTGAEAEAATDFALRAGYRHVDTATMYQNEAEVGAALRSSGVARDQVFVTTKLLPDAVGKEPAALEQSLAKLGLDALDLWLVHWPPSDEALVPVWRAMCRAQEQGLATDIGVSNYSLEQLDRVADATGVMPAVNQIRWSPLLFDAAVLEGHQQRGVVLEGYSALRGGALSNPTVIEVAQETGRTPAQVIIRWHVQHGIVVIPKSANPERITANADLGFTLTAEQMSALDALGS